MLAMSLPKMASTSQRWLNLSTDISPTVPAEVVVAVCQASPKLHPNMM
jgi:hypothetical protein